MDGGVDEALEVVWGAINDAEYADSAFVFVPIPQLRVILDELKRLRKDAGIIGKYA